MARVFITATFKGIENRDEIEYLCSLVKDAGFEDFCFVRDVEHYQKVFNTPKELMIRAREEIEKSDFLLIDMSEKPTGRAIEAGIAHTLGKKIIVIAKKGTTIKDSVRGIADIVIEYDQLEDIVAPIRDYYLS